MFDQKKMEADAAQPPIDPAIVLSEFTAIALRRQAIAWPCCSPNNTFNNTNPTVRMEADDIVRFVPAVKLSTGAMP